MSRSQRYRRIVSVMLDEGFGTLVDQLGLHAPIVKSLWGDRAHGADADVTPEVRLRRTFEKLGPTFAKMGQLLSVRPDLIPASFAEELAKLQDTMAPFPFSQVKELIEDSFGEPLEDLFEQFSDTPAAAASIGQVHMAVLHDGTPVAVKVQRPDIHEVIEADLDILRTQASRVQGRTELGRRYDLVGLVDEFSRAIREETDYINEGQNAERLAQLFEGDETVHFPKVYWERSSSTVLTLERVDGIPFNQLDELDKHGVDRVEAARRGISCYYEQIFMYGFFHADPHPGNLIALPDGRVAFIDFGRCGHLSEFARTQVADLLVAIIEQDYQLATDILLDVSGGSAEVDAIGLQRDVGALIDKYYDKELHEVDSKTLIVEVMSLIGKRGLTMSSEFALLLTTFATLQALGTSVDPRFHFVDSVTPFARRLVEKQMKPEALYQGFVGTIRRSARALQVLPDSITRALKRVGDGDLRMTVRPSGFDALMSRIEMAVDRLAFALVVAAFVVGFSTLLTRTNLPLWMELGADLSLFVAAWVGIFFFASIIFRRFRQRHRDD